MGFWAGIKYALNSTLGTSKFKPLDKLIESMIVDHTGLAGGDCIMGVLYNGSYANHANYSIGTFTPNVDGVVSLHLTCDPPKDSKNEKIVALSIKTDDDVNAYYVYGNDEGVKFSHTQNINVKKNKTYSVIIYSYQGWICSVSIGTAIADPTLLSYTAVS